MVGAVAGGGDGGEHRVHRRRLVEDADVVAAIGVRVRRHRLRRAVDRARSDPCSARTRRATGCRKVRRPTMPPPRPERIKIDGEPMPPAASTKRRAATVMRLPVDVVPVVADDAALGRARRVPPATASLSTRQRDTTRAPCVDGVRQVGDQHRLLGVDGAAHAAVARLHAALDVAAGGVDLQAERLGAVVEHAVVAVGLRVVDLLDVQPLFDRVPVRRQVGRSRSRRRRAPSSSDRRRAAACGTTVVQLTTVVPPTARPCKMVMPRSLVARAPDS